MKKDCVITDCADFRGLERGLGERTDEANEMFTMDAGNRSNVNVKDESDVNYVVDNLTNSYVTFGRQ